MTLFMNWIMEYRHNREIYLVQRLIFRNILQDIRTRTFSDISRTPIPPEYTSEVRQFLIFAFTIDLIFRSCGNRVHLLTVPSWSEPSICYVLYCERVWLMGLQVVPSYEYGELVLKNYKENLSQTRPTVFIPGGGPNISEVLLNKDVVYSEV